MSDFASFMEKKLGGKYNLAGGGGGRGGDVGRGRGGWEGRGGGGDEGRGRGGSESRGRGGDVGRGLGGREGRGGGGDEGRGRSGREGRGGGGGSVLDALLPQKVNEVMEKKLLEDSRATPTRIISTLAGFLSNAQNVEESSQSSSEDEEEPAQYGSSIDPKVGDQVEVLTASGRSEVFNIEPGNILTPNQASNQTSEAHQIFELEIRWRISTSWSLTILSSHDLKTNSHPE